MKRQEGEEKHRDVPSGDGSFLDGQHRRMHLEDRSRDIDFRIIGVNQFDPSRHSCNQEDQSESRSRALRSVEYERKTTRDHTFPGDVCACRYCQVSVDCKDSTSHELDLRSNGQNLQCSREGRRCWKRSILNLGLDVANDWNGLRSRDSINRSHSRIVRGMSES